MHILTVAVLAIFSVHLALAAVPTSLPPPPPSPAYTCSAEAVSHAELPDAPGEGDEVPSNPYYSVIL